MGRGEGSETGGGRRRAVLLIMGSGVGRRVCWEVGDYGSR